MVYDWTHKCQLKKSIISFYTIMHWQLVGINNVE